MKRFGKITVRDEVLGAGLEDAAFWLGENGYSLFVESAPQPISTLLRGFVENMLPRGVVVWDDIESKRAFLQACRDGHVPAESYRWLEEENLAVNVAPTR